MNACHVRFGALTDISRFGIYAPTPDGKRLKADIGDLMSVSLPKADVI
jgi:hypothetical protein